MVEIKCTRWTLGDVWQHLRCSKKIERYALHGASSRDDVAKSQRFITNLMVMP